MSPLTRRRFFSAVAAGEAKLAVEMQGLVFDDEDARVAGNPIAGYVQLFGSAWSNISDISDGVFSPGITVFHN